MHSLFGCFNEHPLSLLLLVTIRVKIIYILQVFIWHYHPKCFKCRQSTIHVQSWTLVPWSVLVKEPTVEFWEFKLSNIWPLAQSHHFPPSLLNVHLFVGRKVSLPSMDKIDLKNLYCKNCECNLVCIFNIHIIYNIWRIVKGIASIYMCLIILL